jgi:hypothetical protein
MDAAKLAQRVERLERENRWWRRGVALCLVLVVAPLLIAQAPTPLRVVEAQRIVVRDDAGRIRATLGTMGGPGSPNPTYGLTVYGPDGNRRIQLFEGGKIDGVVFSMDTARAAFNLFLQESAKKGVASLTLSTYDQQQGERAQEFSSSLSAGTLDETIKKHRQGTTSISMTPERGKPRISLEESGVSRATVGYMELESAGGVKIQRPASSLVLIDKDGKVMWNAP